MDDDLTPPMATPRVAAGVLIRNTRGDVLLVKPTYKEGWEIPGGYVEPGESPRAAAEREVKEELGLIIGIGRLLTVDWAPHPAEGDKILFVFSGDRLTNLNPTSADPTEIDSARFWPTDKLRQALPDRLLRRVSHSLSSDSSIYLENGSP